MVMEDVNVTYTKQAVETVRLSSVRQGVILTRLLNEVREAESLSDDFWQAVSPICTLKRVQDYCGVCYVCGS